MMSHLPSLALAGLAVAAFTLGGGTALAQDCPRGALDERYCDADGDMVADAPTDPAEWVDPPQLIFAYTPVEDPALYREIWAEFLEHLESVTGKPVQFFPVQSYAAQVEAMRAGRLHVAGISTGPTPLGVNCAGYVPFAIMGAEDGSYGYEMEFITHVDSDIRSVEDIRGRTLAFTTPASNSGFRAPSGMLERDFGMVAEVDYTPAFSGAHDNSVLGVANKDYDAAAIANEVMHRMFARGVIDGSQIRTVFKSDTFPTTSYGYAHNLHPELAAKIVEAFFSFEWEGTKLLEEFSQADMTTFLPITYQEHWAPVRDVDELVGTVYSCT
jgi:phosphonate transport system substrate-binding protein